MSDHTSNSTNSGNGPLAFILGGVVVALGVLAWFVFGEGLPAKEQPDIRIELPGGKAIEGEISGN